MARPRFPVNQMGAIPTDPGARNPRAGMSVEERLAWLEGAMRMAPQVGGAPGNGYTISSDTTQVGGSAWRSPAQRIKVGTFNPTATGDKVVTGVGFKPALVQFSVGFLGTNASYAITGEGAMDAAGNQWAHGSIYSEVLGGAEAESYTNRCITLPSDAGANQFIEAHFVSMNADGFTINFDEVSSTAFLVCWTAFA